jgi:hypothetical protein
VRSFTLVNGVVTALGTVVGTALTGANAGTTFVRQVALPVIDITQGASCDILNLTLGPLDLDLLGLQVHLDQAYSTSPHSRDPVISWAICCARSPVCWIRDRAWPPVCSSWLLS